MGWFPSPTASPQHFSERTLRPRHFFLLPSRVRLRVANPPLEANQKNSDGPDVIAREGRPALPLSLTGRDPDSVTEDRSNLLRILRVGDYLSSSLWQSE